VSSSPSVRVGCAPARLSITIRLVAPSLVLALLLVLAGIIGLSGMGRAVDSLESVYLDRAVPIQQLGEIESRLLANRLAIAVSLVTPEPDFIATRMAIVRRNIERITELWDAYMQTALTPEEAALAERFLRDRTAFVSELQRAGDALDAGDVEGARAIVTTRLRPMYEPVADDIARLNALQIRLAEEAFEDAVASYARVRTLMFAAAVAGLLLAAVFGYLLIHSVTRLLEQAMDFDGGPGEEGLSRQLEAASRRAQRD